MKIVLVLVISKTGDNLDTHVFNSDNTTYYKQIQTKANTNKLKIHNSGYKTLQLL